MANLTFKNSVAGIQQLSSADKTVSGNLPLGLTGETIPGSSTTQLILAIDVSTVTGFWIMATVATTLKTNSSGSPTDTLVLVANQRYEWYTGAYDTFKLTGDVTSMFFVVAGATAGAVYMECVSDPTP